MRPKDKGTRFETSAVRWLRAKGHRAVRRVLHGRSDEGDVGAVINGVHFTIECKDRKRVELFKWFDETVEEAANGGGEPMLIIHRPGAGQKNFGKNLAVIELDTVEVMTGGRVVQVGDAMDAMGREVL